MKRIVGDRAGLVVVLAVAGIAVSAITGGEAGAVYLTVIGLFALTLLWERVREPRGRGPKARSGAARSRGSR